MDTERLKDIGYTTAVGAAVGAALLAVLAIGVLALLLAMKPVNERSCDAAGERLGLPTDFDFWADSCFATLDGRQVDVASLRSNEAGR